MPRYVSNRFSKSQSTRIQSLFNCDKPKYHFLNDKRTKIVVPRQKRRILHPREGQANVEYDKISFVTAVPLLQRSEVRNNSITNSLCTVLQYKTNDRDAVWSIRLINVGKKARFLIGVFVHLAERTGRKSKPIKRNYQRMEVLGIDETGCIKRCLYRNDNHVFRLIAEYELDQLAGPKKGDIIKMTFSGINETFSMEIIRKVPMSTFEQLKSQSLNLEYLTHSPFAKVYPAVFGQSLSFEMMLSNESVPFKDQVPPLLDLAMAAAERAQTFGCGKFTRCPIPLHVTEDDGSPAPKFRMVDLERINLPPSLTSRLAKDRSADWNDRKIEGTFRNYNPTADKQLMSVHTCTNTVPKSTILSTYYDTIGNPSFVDWAINARKTLPIDPSDYSDTDENEAENILLENVLEMTYLLSDDEE